MNTAPDLDAIEEGARTATPGPWTVSESIRAPWMVLQEASRDWIAHVGWHRDDKRPDATFIASARTNVPTLCAAVRARDAAITAVTAERDALRAIADAARALVTTLPSCSECDLPAQFDDECEGRRVFRCDDHRAPSAVIDEGPGVLAYSAAVRAPMRALDGRATKAT